MTDEQVEKVVSMLIAAYPTPAWPAATVELYMQLLVDLEYEAASTGVLAMIRTRIERDRPLVAEVRHACREQLEMGGQIPDDLEPDEAWGFVTHCFSRVGRYRDFPRQPHPLVARTVERMGWQTLCDSDNPEATRAHFLAMYRAELSRHRSDRLNSPALILGDDALRLEAAGRCFVRQIGNGK